MNIAIVTGASSGMGREAAKQLDKIFTDKIDEIWLIARRGERLRELSELMNHSTRILTLDLLEEKDLAEFELALNLASPNVKMLVNAAGFGVIGSFAGSYIKEQKDMVELNCQALMRVTYSTLEYMEKGARIVQFASAAAFLPQPGFAVYAASKSFVYSFSKALNMELKEKGISVTAVCPGPVSTEFFTIAEKNEKTPFIKKWFMADAQKVVQKALYDSYKRRSISVYSLSMNIFRWFAKMYPDDLVMKFFCIFKK